MSVPSRLPVLLLLFSLLCVFVLSVSSEEQQCSAPSSAASSTQGETCTSCSSCSKETVPTVSPLPPFPVLTSDSPHYGLLITYDIESCKIKEQYHVLRFLTRARDYGNHLVTRYMSVDVDGNPRLMIFATEAERDVGVIDGSKLSEEQLKAYLLGTAPPPPTPVYDIYLDKVALDDIDKILKYFHIEKGFPVDYYPDEAVQGDLLKH